MKPSSRIFACATPLLALAGCNAAGTDQNTQAAPPLTQQACLREDVQNVVSNEVKSILQKGWFAKASPLSVLLVDRQELQTAFEQARTSFHDVAVDVSSDDTLPIASVVCRAALQIDESNATRGQSIVQFPKLRWSINYSGAVSDPQASAFSIEIDRGSLADDVRINGQPAEDWQQQQQDKARSSQPANAPDDTQEAAGADQSQDERQTSGQAAQEAEAAAQDAQSAAEQAERDLKSELAQ